MKEETKIGMKLHEETEDIKKMCEQLGESIKHEFDKGVENIDTEEMKEAIDMMKDLYEIKKFIVESCYYKQIMEAMEEAEYGEDYDENGRLYYRGQSRDSRGRYSGRGGRRGYDNMMPMNTEDPMNSDRDMDMGYGRMYYSGEGSNQGGNSGRGGSRSNSGNRATRYGFAHDSYMQERSKHSRPEDTGKRMDLLNDFIDDMEDMFKDVVKGMTPEERQIWKVKLNKLVSM